MSQKFNQKSFTLFTINYIVGFGFISTIISLMQLSLFAIIVLVSTIIISFAVSLVFSRLANNFVGEYGGTYAYSKKLNNKRFSFFLGWNQYMQGPILASSSPLFLADAASYFTTDNTILWVIRAFSILFFISLVLVSTFGLKVNKKVIFMAGIIKWTILLLALILTIYLANIENNFGNSFANSKINVYLIFSNILSFMYAFGGIEDVSSMAKDVKFKNFKNILMISFTFILTIYLVFYVVLLGLKIQNYSNFANIFQNSLGIIGLIIFVIGILFNGISSKISINISTSRKLVALVDDGYLFEFLNKKNKKDEYKNAIWFNAIVTIFSMLLFWLLPTLLDLNNFFNSIISIGSIAFLLQYFLTFIIAFRLEKNKIIKKIPIYEKVFYILASIIIVLTLLVYVFPFLVNESWTVNNTITLVSYFAFLGFGYLIQFIFDFKKKKSS